MIDHVILPTLLRFLNYLAGDINMSESQARIHHIQTAEELAGLLFVASLFVFALPALYFQWGESAGRTEMENSANNEEDLGTNDLKSGTYVNKETQTERF